MNLGALTSPNFRTYVAGSIFGLLALWMQRVTIGWLAWSLTESSSFVGATALVMFAPSIVLSPLFGVWADRIDVKRAAIVVQMVNALVMFGFFAAQVTGAMTLPVMLGLALIAGIATAANHPIRMSLTPRLVPRELIGSVVAIVAINFNVARMVGPAVAGLSIGVLGASWTLLVQCLLYLPFLFALSRIEVRPKRDTGKAQAPFWTELRQGVVYVTGAPNIWQAMAMAGVLSVVARGALEVLPPLADGVFGRGPEGLGVILAATGIGAVIGGVFKAWLPPQPNGRLPGLTLVCIVLGLALVAVLGIVGNWHVALVVSGGIAFVTTLTAISVQTAIQMDLEDDMRGRVMSLWAVIAAGGAALGAGLLGLVGDVIGFQETLVLAGSLSAAGMLGFVIRIELRR